jgi:hypothetical protein
MNKVSEVLVASLLNNYPTNLSLRPISIFEMRSKSSEWAAFSQQQMPMKK